MSTYVDHLLVTAGVLGSATIEDADATIYTCPPDRFARVSVHISASEELHSGGSSAVVEIGGSTVYASTTPPHFATLANFKMTQGQSVKVFALGNDTILFTVYGAEFDDRVLW